MPPKEDKKYSLRIFNNNGNPDDVLDVPVAEINFDSEEELFNFPWLSDFNDLVEVHFTINRKPSVEIFFPKKHRRNASIARRRRRYHGRTKNVCQNNNRQ